jgi:hypothetical protein
MLEKIVELASETEGAEIWYTTDGSMPVKGNGIKYSGPILLTQPALIKAVAVKEGMRESRYLTASFRILRRTGASIKDNFGVEAAGKAGVNDTFYAVHEYLRGKKASQLASDNLIQLGDYIDLEGGLTVEPTAENPAGGDDANNGAVNAANTPVNGGANGTLLRLIVVGLNSFNAQGQYTGNGNGESAHLVFQFQNVPARHRMTVNRLNYSGYESSEMRAYITGNFYRGLISAGVPDSVIWAPKRIVAAGGNGSGATRQIEDKLWLTTGSEVYGSGSGPETEQNQAHFEYYSPPVGPPWNLLLVKYTVAGSDVTYWQASPYTSDGASFWLVNGFMFAAAEGDNVDGVAPAFCIR